MSGFSVWASVPHSSCLISELWWHRAWPTLTSSSPGFHVSIWGLLVQQTLKASSLDSDVIQVMISHSSAYRASVCKLEGRLKGEWAEHTHQTFLVKDGAKQSYRSLVRHPPPRPLIKGDGGCHLPSVFFSFKAVGGLEWKEVNSPFYFSLFFSFSLLFFNSAFSLVSDPEGHWWPVCVSMNRTMSMPGTWKTKFIYPLRIPLESCLRVLQSPHGCLCPSGSWGYFW